MKLPLRYEGKMAYRIEYYCDGCGCKIDQADIQETERLFLEWAAANNVQPQARQTFQETFCAKNRARASDYWTARHSLMQQLARENIGRLEKQRNRFWQQLKVVVRDESQGTSG